MDYTAIVLSVPALAAQFVAATTELPPVPARVVELGELERQHRAMRARFAA